MALCDELEAVQAKRESRRDRLVAAALAGISDSQTEIKDSKFFINHLPRITARPEHIKQLRQTILNLAVCGKLVPQDPKDEQAAEILARIGRARNQLSKTKSYDNGTRPTLTDIPFGWIAVKFNEILLTLQTGPFGSSLHQHDYEEGGIPVVNPASIQNERIVPIPKMAIGVKTLERLATFKLKENDVVMGRRGEMGRCAVVTKKEVGWLCGTGSLILRFTKDISPWFIVKLMSAPSIRAYLGGASVGATMQNLNQSILNEMPIGLPPLPEQNRIVAKVDELMALCDELETRLTTTTATRSQLLGATLVEALAVN
jgi:type I restriction enzyme S subunit